MTVDTGECRDRLKVRELMELCPTWIGACNDFGGRLIRPDGEIWLDIEETGEWALEAGWGCLGIGNTVEGLREALERL